MPTQEPKTTKGADTNLGLKTIACMLLILFAALPTIAAAPKAQTTFDASTIGQSKSHTELRESRTSELVCGLSSFFSIDPDEIFRSRATLEGRGLVTCRNSQGFTTELPVRISLEAVLPEHYDRDSEYSFSANSSPFVIPREVNELQDAFLIAPPIEATDGTASSPALLLRGLRHDLVIGLRLNSQKSHLNGIRVTSLEVKFDEEAPDLF